MSESVINEDISASGAFECFCEKLLVIAVVVIFVHWFMILAELLSSLSYDLSLISIALSSVSETGSYHLMFVAEMRLFLLEQQIGGFWQALNSRSYGNI